MSATVFLVKRVLDEIRPMLAPDGGDVELVTCSGGTARVRYEKGQNDECSDCVMPPEDFRDYLADLLRERVDNELEVEVVEWSTGAIVGAGR